MKNKFKISLFPAVCLVVLLAFAIYGLAYFLPSISETRVIKQETMNLNAEAQLYAPHLSDHTELNGQIDKINAEIAELHNSGYTNEGTVSLMIGEAILAYEVVPNSISIGELTETDGNDALPINLELSGDMDKLLSFVEYFEKNEEGSFLVYYTELDTNGYRCSLLLDMYLCTPKK